MYEDMKTRLVYTLFHSLLTHYNASFVLIISTDVE